MSSLRNFGAGFIRFVLSDPLAYCLRCGCHPHDCDCSSGEPNLEHYREEWQEQIDLENSVCICGHPRISHDNKFGSVVCRAGNHLGDCTCNNFQTIETELES